MDGVYLAVDQRRDGRCIRSSRVYAVEVDLSLAVSEIEEKDSRSGERCKKVVRPERPSPIAKLDRNARDGLSLGIEDTQTDGVLRGSVHLDHGAHEARTVERLNPRVTLEHDEALSTKALVGKIECPVRAGAL
jgi:hypothetical protein